MESGLRVFLTTFMVAIGSFAVIAVASSAQAGVTTFSPGPLKKSCGSLFVEAKERDLQIHRARFEQFEIFLQKAVIEKAGRGDRKLKVVIDGADASDLRRIANSIAEVIETVTPLSTMIREPWRIEAVVYDRNVDSLLNASRDVRRALSGGQVIRYRFEAVNLDDARQLRRVEFEKPDVFVRFDSN